MLTFPAISLILPFHLGETCPLSHPLCLISWCFSFQRLFGLGNGTLAPVIAVTQLLAGTEASSLYLPAADDQDHANLLCKWPARNRKGKEVGIIL